MKSPCYLVTLSLEISDFQTFLKQYVILVPFGALIYNLGILRLIPTKFSVPTTARMISIGAQGQSNGCSQKEPELFNTNVLW